MLRGQPAAAAEAFGRAANRVAPLADKFKLVPLYEADLARYRLNMGKALTLAGQSDAGRMAIQQALDLWTKLSADATLATDSQVQMLDCLHALGDLERRAGQPKRALEWFDRCLKYGETLRKRTPPVPALQPRLRDAWWGKAEALTTLAQYPDAIAAWDHAVALADPSQLVYLKVFRLTALARTGEYEQAIIEVDPLAVQARANGEAMFHVARVYALAAHSAAADSKLTQADRARRAGEIAERAVDNLKLAQTKGYFANAVARDALAKNPDLDSLRGRPDFQKLLTDINTKPPAAISN
jgi:tetratricopeptide (TPR) repeat protein